MQKHCRTKEDWLSQHTVFLLLHSISTYRSFACTGQSVQGRALVSVRGSVLQSAAITTALTNLGSATTPVTVPPLGLQLGQGQKIEGTPQLAPMLPHPQGLLPSPRA